MIDPELEAVTVGAIDARGDEIGVAGQWPGRDGMDIFECSLAELMDDPLIGLVMKSDGVDRRELELLLSRIPRLGLPAIQHANPRRAGLLSAEIAQCSRR